MSDIDLELKQLENFHGSEEYHEAWLGVLATDGVKYVMDNGYSWLATDAISVIKTELDEQPFLVVKLNLLPEKKAQMTIDDGNGNMLYTQDYDHTDAKRELKLYYTDGVILLPGEY